MSKRAQGRQCSCGSEGGGEEVRKSKAGEEEEFGAQGRREEGRGGYRIHQFGGQGAAHGRSTLQARRARRAPRMHATQQASPM